MTKLIQCPACRARPGANQGRESRICRRCNSDLGLLYAVHDRARAWQHQARQCMAQGWAHAAVGAALAAQSLVNSTETRATLAAALALARSPHRPTEMSLIQPDS